MKSLVFYFSFLICVVSVVCDKLVLEEQESSRDAKFLNFLKQLFQPAIAIPTSGNDSKGKYGETGVNYNQYFVNADPYNQNQLLMAAGTEKVPSTLEVAASENGVQQGELSDSGINSMNTLFSTLIGDDTSSTSSIISNILSFGTGSMEKVLKRVNAFDTLKCIPRLLCQTVAQRQLDTTKSEITTTVKPRIPVKSTAGKYGVDRDGKTIKFLGVDTALEQFMAFLDLFQLKNWPLYPYLKGAYEGAQVKRLDECAQRFDTCPFSEQQLVYYFNNYNGGFFQAFRSD